MKTMKMAMALLLGSLAAQAYADTATPQNLPVETYDYSTRLDIEHVISITEPANECAPVPVQMVYEDSHGDRHVLQYQVMGTGCSS
ncbi:hypothetical protein ABIA54_000051 [Pseudomonas sp. EB276 TE3739]|uniref:DUF2790 domain-containing protein n=1 Tax=Pseudomonas TaxID=286 RepID=UPI00093747C8|nr:MULTISPECIES: DUF2790 domain-containing protein [Pseudomonas fluorescens group]MCP1475856.1 hypothetical protein [Pseudomonas koreensis]OJT49262.1 hypothetical protein BSZ28_21400 [Pseudomonas moraviensis]